MPPAAAPPPGRQVPCELRTATNRVYKNTSKLSRCARTGAKTGQTSMAVRGGCRAAASGGMRGGRAGLEGGVRAARTGVRLKG